ncbi:GAF domain-containing protein [Cesiribacter sp. SM1]|uniref:GAF domain-containing protein n=1 Tax=Cesiribacter sp. SM1 TaxID=2861196 RepID=UPI001CD2EDD9|nr:GAF domain-containing protein [Cesiribacter sp. SM1]
MRFPYKLIKSESLEVLKSEYEKLLSSNKAATAFIKEIENGNLEARFSFEDGSAEGLSQALRSMQAQLQKIAEEELERNWSTKGLALFADILRSDATNAADFYQKIISNLVKYLNANQGGLFLVEGADTEHITLDLVSCYAYNRQKHISKQIAPGEGVIGQCFLEKETIYLTDVPNEYIKITSGLGAANPSCLVVVPLKINSEVHGIIELASFDVLKPYQVEFLEKLGESIASTLSNVKVNERTKRLLQDSQQQAEELRAQEEEMRQNLEELNATQENQARLQKELLANEEELRAQLEVLQETRAEIDRVRQLEQERANERIESQKKATEKLVVKFRQNEQDLKAELQKLREELNNLKTDNITPHETRS